MTAVVLHQPTTRPALRVLEGGRSSRALARQAVYRRRRLAVLLVTLVATAAVVAATLLAGTFLAGAALAGTAGGGTPIPVAGTSSAIHVVRPGDTLWSIARTIDPGGDVRITVDQLAALNGRAPLQVGQRLLLP